MFTSWCNSLVAYGTNRGKHKRTFEPTSSRLIGKDMEVLPLNHVFIDELGHDGDGHGGRRGGQNVLDLRILGLSHTNSDM